MTEKQVGFECEFVEKPPKAFQCECPVCLLVLREPYQVTCCGYAFCRGCIDEVKQNNNTCPCCNKTFDTFEDKRLKRSLYQLKVYCSNKQQGCQWEGELGQLDNHLNYNPTKDKQVEGCQFAKIKCLYCFALLLRSDIQIHQNNICFNRPFSCQYCKIFNSSYIDVTVGHWPVCGYYPLHCTNKCGQTLHRQNLQSHITTDCPLTIIDCDFQHVGCEVRLPRKDMPAHLQEGVVTHLSLQATSFQKVVARLEEEKSYKKVIARLEEENKQLKQQVATSQRLVKKLTEDLQRQNISTPTCPVEFTLTKVEQKIKADKRWQSPPFYTHLKGYKMFLRVHFNGNGRSRGTHISIFIRLMKGEFDDQLKWPFEGKIEIILLDQDRFCEHYNETIKFNDFTGQRVMRGEEGIYANGSQNFISHNDLRLNYLQGKDCLTLRCLYKF